MTCEHQCKLLAVLFATMQVGPSDLWSTYFPLNMVNHHRWSSFTMMNLTNVFFRWGLAFLSSLAEGFWRKLLLICAVGLHHLAFLRGDDVLLFAGLLSGWSSRREVCRRHCQHLCTTVWPWSHWEGWGKKMLHQLKQELVNTLSSRYVPLKYYLCLHNLFGFKYPK